MMPPGKFHGSVYSFLSVCSVYWHTPLDRGATSEDAGWVDDRRSMKASYCSA